MRNFWFKVMAVLVGLFGIEGFNLAFLLGRNDLAYYYTTPGIIECLGLCMIETVILYPPVKVIIESILEDMRT